MTAVQTEDVLLRSIRERVEGRNINQETLLATDYMNHFSEVIMLLEMSVDMPDMLDDIADWKPKTYEEHFRTSGLSEADLIIEAYHLSPPEYKEPFDAAVAELIEDIKHTLEEALVLVDEGDPNILKSLLESALPEIHRFVDQITAIVNTGNTSQAQADIDAIFD